jgi:hypothetical protein
MPSPRLPAVLIAAIMLVGSVGEGALATPAQPVSMVPGAVVNDQAAATPVTPTTAFEPAECPVDVARPEGAEPAVCGLVTVPQRHATPDAGRSLELAVVRVPATGERRDPAPVVVLAGGADRSALDLAPTATDWLAAFPGRDLVLMDHRGGHHSTPFLRCVEADAARLSQALGETRGADSLDAHVAAWSACAARLRSAEFDLPAFDATEAATDIGAVVAALGYADGFHRWRWARARMPRSPRSGPGHRACAAWCSIRRWCRTSRRPGPWPGMPGPSSSTCPRRARRMMPARRR